jgi:hypothetical protein
MASSTSVIEVIDRITAEEFNTGFNAIRDTIETEKRYYANDVAITKLKNDMFMAYTKLSLEGGVLFKLLYNDNLAIISGGKISENYLDGWLGFVYPDANNSLAYQYSEDFLTSSELAMKAFLPTIGCIGLKTSCNTNRKLYQHKVSLASQSYAQHTLTTDAVDENGSLTVYQTYIQT